MKEGRKKRIARESGGRGGLQGKVDWVRGKIHDSFTVRIKVFPAVE